MPTSRYKSTLDGLMADLAGSPLIGVRYHQCHAEG